MFCITGVLVVSLVDLFFFFDLLFWADWVTLFIGDGYDSGVAIAEVAGLVVGLVGGFHQSLSFVVGIEGVAYHGRGH